MFCGDPHVRFDHILRTPDQLHVSAVIVLGDMEPVRPLHKELASIANKLWYIHCNHDTDSEQNWNHLWSSKLADRNLDGRVGMFDL